MRSIEISKTASKNLLKLDYSDSKLTFLYCRNLSLLSKGQERIRS